MVARLRRRHLWKMNGGPAASAGQSVRTLGLSASQNLSKGSRGQQVRRKSSLVADRSATLAGWSSDLGGILTKPGGLATTASAGQ